MQTINSLLLHNNSKAFDQINITFDQNNITTDQINTNEKIKITRVL